MNNEIPISNVRAFPPKEDFDIEFVRVHCDKITAIVVLMHGALSEIVKTDLSPQGAIDMKSTAVTALCEVQKTARELGINNFVAEKIGENDAKTNHAKTAN